MIDSVAPTIYKRTVNWADRNSKMELESGWPRLISVKSA
jgi:hypothetical protein